MRRIVRLFVLSALTLVGCDSEDKVIVVDDAFGIRADIKLKVGDITYEDVDAGLVVRGYNSSGTLVYSESFDYAGGSENLFIIDQKCHTYRISLEKWGITDERVFSYAELYRLRANGPDATTLSFGGETGARRLTGITYLHSINVDGNFQMQPLNKQVYSYAIDGKVTRLDYLKYDADNNSFVPDRHHVFHYSNGTVHEITGYYAGNEDWNIKQTYEYDGTGKVKAIQVTNKNLGINTTVDLAYNDENRQVTATYSFSNGNGFVYSLACTNNNIVNSKTVQGGQTCSEGTYSYDKHINPMRHLGYVDVYLENLSVNNRISENIEYHACGFPDLIPQSFAYSYANNGYPLKKVIHYNSGARSELHFDYQ